MKTIMKSTIGLLMAILVILTVTSCNKLKQDEQSPTRDLSFAIEPGASTGSLKAGDCFSVKSDYVKVRINNVNYKLDVVYINDKPYTNVIKLAPGSYTLNEFQLFTDNNTPSTENDDQLLAATPHTGSTYSGFVSQSLERTFTVDKFEKNELPIEVVCYDTAHFTNFGFEYFQIGQIAVHTQAFFGDIFVKNPQDYAGSLYAGQSHGLKIDMPAIFKIEVYRNGTFYKSFNNEAWKGEGQPLIVEYVDNLDQADSFEFRLSILVRKGTVFSYEPFYTWTTTDDIKISGQGTDGMIDFALGSGNPAADVILPPWMNLPPTCTYQIQTNYAPGSMGGYVDAKLTNCGTGYEIINGTYQSWCCDNQTTIGFGNYNMKVYSSLYPNSMPDFAKVGNWDHINWLINHLDWYPGYLWSDLQGALWLFDVPTAWNGIGKSGVPNKTAMMQQMYNDANTYGANYRVPQGGWACIVFIDASTPSNAPNALVQTMIVKIDP